MTLIHGTEHMSFHSQAVYTAVVPRGQSLRQGSRFKALVLATAFVMMAITMLMMMTTVKTRSNTIDELSSCVGNSCGNANGDYGVYWGGTHENPTNVREDFLVDDQVEPMIGSNQGMYNDYSSVRTNWWDTTNMDNLRGADITDHSVAGTLEAIPLNTPANRASGHSVHTPSGESAPWTPNHATALTLNAEDDTDTEQDCDDIEDMDEWFECEDSKRQQASWNKE